MLDGQPDSGSRDSGSKNINATVSNKDRFNSAQHSADNLVFEDQNEGLLETDAGNDVVRTSSTSSNQQRKTAAGYVEKTKYGVADPDEADEDIQAEIQDKTPTTQRRVVKEAEQKAVKKLGPLATCFTIFKGFVATGILYVPKDFKNGGYIFTPITLIASLIVTLYCARLLLDVNERIGGGSFPEMGKKAYGKPGKIFVEIVLVASQFGFCTAYVYFIASQIGGEGGVIPCITGDKKCMDGVEIEKWIWMPICMAIYVPLVMVRKIEVFAITHAFGDAMIIITLIIIFVYAGMDISDKGPQMDEIKPVGELWADAIGFSVYTYEGIGVILPIQEVTADKKNYYKLLCITVTLIATLYIIFGEFTVIAWGDTKDFDEPLITACLPEKNVVTYIVKILFSFNLFFSYPLVIHPANLVIESWLFEGWAKTRKRQMSKNLSRTIVVALSCVVALAIYEKLDRFLSITGALTCIPVAFLIPAALHLEVIAKKDNNKTSVIIDWAILIGGTIALLYCTTMAIITFND